MAEKPEIKCSFLLHSEGYMGAIPNDSFAMFCERFPDQVEQRKDNNGRPLKVTTWGLKGISPDDPLLKHALDFAGEIGLEIPVDQSRMKSGIEFKVYRMDQHALGEYSHFARAALIGVIMAEAWFDEEGKPWVICDSRLRKTRSREIGGIFAFPDRILVRGQMKQLLEHAGLKGLELRPLGLLSLDPRKGKGLIKIPWPEDIEPLYQVYSSVELPVCKNWMFDNKGRVFHPRDRDFLPDGCMPLNGRELMGALHYSKAEIEPFMDFDIVRTYERYWGYVPTLLVSKRLLKIFKELGIKRMDCKYGYFTVIDDEPWELGTDGPLHSRYSGPAPNQPVD
jgi:hypothetical protein